MLRHPRRAARVALLATLALAIAGCGIKGPLVAPPKPETAAPADGAATGERAKRPDPKL
jgi:predicted small lipoprotein YifL